eukprot:TRINITY_DN12050_c0_g1_i2.p1 TRINITY_DN12050_c0_g1~~TRINITY_DN12050_c0_g1_i2.p1  ORF type:complete len:159 (+),score=33.33 TRINITY_DN12050_c0_g1_i2:92-568(+)
MESLYEAFKAHVANARKLDPQHVEEVAQGRIWSGSMAQEHGLVDSQGTFLDAVLYTKQLMVQQRQKRGLYDMEEWEIRVLDNYSQSRTLNDLLQGSQPVLMTRIAETWQNLREINQLAQLCRDMGLTPSQIRRWLVRGDSPRTECIAADDISKRMRPQ